MQKSVFFLLLILFTIGSISSVYAFYSDGWQNVFCKIMIFGSPDFLECDNMKDTLTFKAGQDISISLDNSTDMITISAIVNSFDENGTNLGTSGATIFRGENNHIWNFARIYNGDNVLVTENSTGVIISAAGSVGEANTGANVGTGTGQIFRDKTGVTLNFKTIKEGNNISITNNVDDITISSISGNSSLNDLTDVTLSNVAYGHILQFTNTEWQNKLFKANTITCSGSDKLSAFDNQTGVFSCSSDQSGSGGPTVLNSDVTCSLTTSYCTVFTIPLTPSSGNAVTIHLIAKSSKSGVAVQTRVRGDDAQILGFCNHRTYTSSTGEALDTLTVAGTPADTGETAWFVGANVPAPINISCSVEADSTPSQNLIVEIQMETTGTGTIKAGSYYIKTP